MKKILIAITAAAILSSNGAWAGFYNGSELLQDCSDTGVAYSHCQGYVAGTSDAYDALVDALKLNRAICLPEGITVGQSVKVVVKDLQEHPQDLHLDAAGSILAALMTAFPCELPS